MHFILETLASGLPHTRRLLFVMLLSLSLVACGGKGSNGNGISGDLAAVLASIDKSSGQDNANGGEPTADGDDANANPGETTSPPAANNGNSASASTNDPNTSNNQNANNDTPVDEELDENVEEPPPPLAPKFVQLSDPQSFLNLGFTARAYGLNGNLAQLAKTNDGWGINDGTKGIPVPTQINRLPDDRAEKIVVEFGAKKYVMAIEVTLTHLMPKEGGGERAILEGFDERGDKVAELVFGPSTPGITKNGTVTATLQSAKPLHSVAIWGLPYVNGNKASKTDSSDFYVKEAKANVYSLP